LKFRQFINLQIGFLLPQLLNRLIPRLADLHLTQKPFIAIHWTPSTRVKMRIIQDILPADITLAITATTSHLVAAFLLYETERAAVTLADEGFGHGFFDYLAC
jgi:hypothetical protein